MEREKKNLMNQRYIHMTLGRKDQMELLSEAIIQEKKKILSFDSLSQNIIFIRSQVIDIQYFALRVTILPR